MGLVAVRLSREGLSCLMKNDYSKKKTNDRGQTQTVPFYSMIFPQLLGMLVGVASACALVSSKRA